MVSNPKFAKLDGLKAQVRTHLAEYIKGFVKMGEGNFCCINPLHDDKNPSCGIVKGNRELFHCFSCGAVGDIFVAANMLEQKPLKGAGFLAENLFYLAKKFGHEAPNLELTADEQHDLDTYRAYAIASQILVTSTPSDRVAAKLQAYGWNPKKTLRDLGIGSVVSFDDFTAKMTKTYGFDRQFLKNVDLDNKRIFSPDNLVFTVCDEHGQPVGFAARNLLFDSLKADYEAAKGQFGEDSEQAKEARTKLKMSPKFVNSSQEVEGETELKNRIYQKGTRLFGFHIARKNAPPLYIFEGYGDCATAYNAGLHNACAIGSTSFSEEHLNLVLDMGLSHVIFVLDADKAGATGTDRFVELVEKHLGGHVGLKVQIVIMPDGSDDPDAFIRKNGLDAFMALEKVDVFTWKLQQLVKSGHAEPDTVIEANIGLIMNEQNHVKRLRMAEALSKATATMFDAIWSEVLRRQDQVGQQITEELSLLADRTSKMLTRSPDKIKEILMDSTQQVDRINTMHKGYDLGQLTSYIDGIFETADAHVADSELKLGWPLFDKLFGGVPHADAFISIPGKPNQGKSSWLANVAHRLVDNNDDVIVLYHTVDDAMRWFLPRLFGSKYGIASEHFYKAGYHLNNNTLVKPSGETSKVRFRDVYEEAKKWFKAKMAAERLLVYDAAMLDNNVFSLEMRVRDIRKRYPTTPIVVFGDNFHLYTNPAMKEEGEAKTRGLSMACKNLANVQHVTMIMTMELPKTALEEGKRPRMINIKGSAGISYDASANIGIYNDQKDRREAADLTWDEEVEPQMDPMNPGQMVTRIRRPILELVFDKSKVNGGFDGNLYYAFNQTSGRVLECSPLDQDIYRKKAARYQEQARRGNNNDQPSGAQFGYDSFAPGAQVSDAPAPVDDNAESPFM